MGTRRERNEHHVMRESGLREARQRFGGLDLRAALAGMLGALGLTVLLGAATAVTLGVRHDQGADEGNLWVVGGITAAVVLVVALFVGGWVAGRIGRYDGTGNGWFSGLLFALLLGGAAAGGNWANDRWGLLNDFQAPGWLADPSRMAEIGVSLVGIAAVLLAAGLGGAVGSGYHRRADALIVDTQDEAAMQEKNVSAVRNKKLAEETVSGEADSTVERSTYASRHSRT